MTSLDLYIGIVGAIVATFTLLSLVFKFLIMPNVYTHIDKRTEQIQPDANGGKSLPDIALLLGELKSDLKHIDIRVGKIEKCLKIAEKRDSN